MGRDWFPIFNKNPGLYYLDSAATTLKPKVVIERMMEYYTEYSANIHRGLYPMSERATEEYESVRDKVAKFVGADRQEVIFTSGTTDSLNLVARGWGEENLKTGDEIMVTIAEHHSNFVPWQELALRNNLKFEIFDLEKGVSGNTRLLAINHVSNVLGVVNPIKEIIARARRVNPEICVVVDGAQAVAHIPIDMMDLDCDFYTFSGHKMYGPTGAGVLFAKQKRQVEMSPAKFGGGMIERVSTDGSTWAKGVERFEAGTPAIGEVIGLGAAIDFMTEVGLERIGRQEKELTSHLIDEIQKISWISTLSNGTGRIGLVSFYPNREKIGSSHDIADVLGREFGVCVRAGHHCAMPLHEKNNILTGTVRVSLGVYNRDEDIDRLIDGLQEYGRRFV